MHPMAPIIILSPVFLIIIIVLLIVRHRTKVQTKRIEKENDRAALEKIVDAIGQDSINKSTSDSSIPVGVSQHMQKIRMNCQKCGGSTTLDVNQQIVFCPFCGAKELLIESDYIKEARIKAEMHEKLAAEKRKTATDLYEQYRQTIREHGKEARKNKVNSALTNIIGVLAGIIVCVILIIGIVWGFGLLIEHFKNR